jgi:hypothetical protein
MSLRVKRNGEQQHGKSKAQFILRNLKMIERRFPRKRGRWNTIDPIVNEHRIRTQRS